MTVYVDCISNACLSRENLSESKNHISSKFEAVQRSSSDCRAKKTKELPKSSLA